MDAQLLLQLDGSMLEAQLALNLGHLQLWFYDLIQNSKKFRHKFSGIGISTDCKLLTEGFADLEFIQSDLSVVCSKEG